MDVSVCICTCRRRTLADTIASVLRQDCLGRIEAELIVCDDDPARSAQAKVQALAASSPIAIRYVASGAGNVAAARNLCLGAAAGCWIAFIDDDEKADADWLSQLLATQVAHDADVVKGFVRALYPDDTPPYVLAGNPYQRDYGPTGTRLRVSAAGNVLFRRALAVDNNIRFDERFGRSGGEDTDFFRRYGALGARMVASREAVVSEIVPHERVTADYFRRRYLRLGQTNARQLGPAGGLARAGEGVKAAILVALLSIYPLTPFLGGRAYFRCFSKFWYSRGMLQGLRGLATEEMS